MLLDQIKDLGPAFFDIFGSLAFLYVVFIAYALLRKRRISRFWAAILLLVGLGGLLVDLFFVSSTYLVR